ncbi:MAG: hypothetical protein QOI04_1187 [Verrucomicrobiota bacterium]|jgi:hypothetical protein
MLKNLITAACVLALQLSIATSAQSISSIKLERTACLGTCPIYSVTIFSDGQLRYKGEAFVKARGTRTKRIRVANFETLAVKVDQIRFFDLQPAYPARKTVTDLPSTFITVTRGNVTKRVEDYMDAPKQLHELEQLIHRVANVSSWVELDEESAAKEFDRAIRRVSR